MNLHANTSKLYGGKYFKDKNFTDTPKISKKKFPSKICVILYACGDFYSRQFSPQGNAGMSPYSASKAGVIGLVKSAGKEYATTGNVPSSIPL